MFNDRTEAGRRLARALIHLKAEHPIVLALPRGGVPVAFEVAQTLDTLLDVLLIRKIGAPEQPELAVAAVVDGRHPEVVVNREIAELVGADDRYIAEQRALKLAEIEERRKLYRRGRPPPDVAGATVIVVDDGMATGATARAALKALRSSGVRRLVLAVPVAPPDLADALKSAVDELVVLETPESFRAVGAHYRDFRQITSDEVVELLDRAWLITDPTRLDGIGPGELER